MTTATQTGPRLTITGTCEGCCHVVDDRGVPLCGLRGEPQSALDRIAFSLRTDWVTPPTCPLLPAARLALARSVVAAADDVLCSKCGKPVTTADEKSYRMHSMAGCPR